jgi:hypothetical protein
VLVCEIALADVDGTLPLFGPAGTWSHGQENPGARSIFASDATPVPQGSVRVTTLDAFFEVEPVSRLDLVKVDIEGAELPFLRGADRTLARFRPHLIVEVADRTARNGGYRARDILAWLCRLGYTFRRIERRGRLREMRILRPFQNVLCIPAGALG